MKWMWLWKILDYRESSTFVNRKRKIKTLWSQQCRLRWFFGFFFSLHKFHNLLKKEQIFNLLPLSMLLEIVKIISGNITVLMQHLLDALLERFRRTNLILWRDGFQNYKNFSQRFHLLSDDRTLPTQYQMNPQEQLFCRWKLYIHLFRQKWFTLNLQVVHYCSSRQHSKR